VRSASRRGTKIWDRAAFFTSALLLQFLWLLEVLKEEEREGERERGVSKKIKLKWVFSVCTYSYEEKKKFIVRTARRKPRGPLFYALHPTPLLTSDATPELGSFARLEAKWNNWGRFHQHFTPSFYTHRSQKRQKYSQVVSLFFPFGICFCKRFASNVGEIDPWSGRLEETKKKGKGMFFERNVI